MSAHLEVEALTKSHEGALVLDEISLSVPKGGVLALFGASGSGKTVLLRCIAGATPIDRGRVRLGGVDVTHAPPEHRALGMAFQNFALFPHMSAFENIAAPLRAARIGAEEIRRKVEATAELLDIGHVLGHRPKALSNGQKQRTALARALVGEPDTLLLDDPLRNVDAKLRFEMRLELPKLLADRGATVIYVTQDYKEAMALGDAIAVLENGRVVQHGSPSTIYDAPIDAATASLFGDPAINLLEVEPMRDRGGAHAMLGGARVDLGPLSGDPAKVLLGLRPEDLRFAEEGLEAEIAADTPLNEKIVTLATLEDGRELLVSRPSDAPPPEPGAKLAFDPDAIHLFDPETGRRIGAEAQERAS